MGLEIFQNIQRDLGCCLFWGGGSVVVDSLFIAAPVVYGRFVFDPCFCGAVIGALSVFFQPSC